ncbi:hypothetical protein BSL78_13430 [Apostichopus japonicus]|uniref:Protein YIPF6 n=1 Tax=Stichopus japonicus TaxID=307972 RepID=A0A2G8KP24_STIJA|nr:hypothetical protein BSL78_13430 [Apostichopus japonicus]
MHPQYCTLSAIQKVLYPNGGNMAEWHFSLAESTDGGMTHSPMLEPQFTDLELEHPVDGDITIPGAQDEETDISTLDEPVIDTIMRDASAVGKKFFHVLYPKQSKSLLKEWDLWGPLILCTLMAILLQGGATGDSSGPDGKGKYNKPETTGFSQVFGLMAFGAVAVALNSKLLGGSL